MPKIDFDFRGYVRGANITEATNADGEKVDVSKMSGTELQNRLNDGELCITLGDHLYESSKNEIEMLDFEATLVWPDEA
jgi:hypothetical protein